MATLDRERMLQALALAESAIGVSDPNPRVGCVIGDENGNVFGSGHTQAVGGAHAEAMALAQCLSAGARLVGATAWVTLEPCSHFGRTPPCCDALIKAGIGRVVVAAEDPFPMVRGSGIARLRDARITVDHVDASIVSLARELNIGYFSRLERKRPWVRMKVAASLDGRTALSNGSSQWITCETARHDSHLWRKRASAILTGIGTVLHDDPRMDVRYVQTEVQPLRIVADTHLRTPEQARIRRPPGRFLIATGHSPFGPQVDPYGDEVLTLPKVGSHLDLDALLEELAIREVNELHVEAGPTLNGAMLATGKVDELLVYVAPKLLGDGLGIAALPPLSSLDSSRRFVFHDVQMLGDDLRLRLRA
jgi:diaminohydroxyphosphoribosylaminopyrimidine deaminase / 5-amino-6-(5-phosphoribosylamino)uracil reductase